MQDYSLANHHTHTMNPRDAFLIIFVLCLFVLVLIMVEDT